MTLNMHQNKTKNNYLELQFSNTLSLLPQNNNERSVVACTTVLLSSYHCPYHRYLPMVHIQPKCRTLAHVYRHEYACYAMRLGYTINGVWTTSACHTNCGCGKHIFHIQSTANRSRVNRGSGYIYHTSLCLGRNF
jgi:hypothetical protein